jgi:hypothetical protein
MRIGYKLATRHSVPPSAPGLLACPAALGGPPAVLP